MKLASATVSPSPSVGQASGMKLVVTIPALNEEKTIAQVIAGVPRNLPGVDEVEVIVMNDGSTDRTAEVAQRAGAIVVNLIGRPGLGYVFRTGLERYRLARGTWPAALADLPPGLLPSVPLDPFDAAPLCYQRIEHGVVISSIGPDSDHHDWLPAQFTLWNIDQRRQPPKPAEK